MNTNARRHADEAGSTLMMALLALTIIAFLMLIVGTQTMSSLFVGKQARDNSVGMAAADSGIEKYRFALQSHIADEFDRWMLTRADLEWLVNQKITSGKNAGKAMVIASGDAQERSWGLQPALLEAPYRYTVREETATGFSFWQVYHVVPPSRMKGTESSLTVYFRAWATGADPASQSTSSPRLFRAEYRPGYFSDYQIVTDATFLVENNRDYQISGPIHSNGYKIQDASWSGTGAQGIKFDPPGPTCLNGAEFSTARSATIDVPGASCNSPSVPRNRRSRELNLLGVADTYTWLATRCNRTLPNDLVICIDRTWGPPYRIRLATNGVFVQGRIKSKFFKLRATDLDSASLTILADDEIELSGQLDTSDPAKAARVTIANRRVDRTASVPRVFLSATNGARVGARFAERDVVSVITQGDIVLPLRPSGCLNRVALAAISQSGSITIPTQYATQAAPATFFTNGQLECSGNIEFIGSYSMHGQFLASKAWRQADGTLSRSIGYPNVKLSYGDVFYRNSPPAFPIATPWAISKAKEADRTCLDRLTQEPTCE